MESFDFVSSLKNLIIMIPALMFAVIIHELGHGYVAYRLGDKTPKIAGRLTFNPIPHIDLLGTIIFPAILLLFKAPFIFGWAKPVPVNPYNVRGMNYRKAMAIISFAGPGANFASALVFAIMFHILDALSGSLVSLLGANLAKAILQPLGMFLFYGVSINVILGIFNLLPIPSFDGWRVLLSFLPRDLEAKLEPLEPYGFIIVIMLLVLHIIDLFIIPPYRLIMSLLIGV
ncbi:site-2 protease family protein [Persephonella sp.]